jgi:DNA polymerase I-like protein with 3'-5' exonuclease and polymerase domains
VVKYRKKLAAGEYQHPLPVDLPETNWERLAELPDLRHVRSIALDTEERDDGLLDNLGPGWATQKGHVIGISVAWKEDGQTKSFYAPIAHEDSDNFEKAQIKQWLKDHRNLTWIMHNAPYDLGWLKTDLGIDQPECIHDVSAMAFITDEERPGFSLDRLCRNHGIQGTDMGILERAARTYEIKNPRAAIHRLPAKYVGDYAEQDAVATLSLSEIFLKEIERQNVMEPYQLEIDLIPLVIEMRRRGIRVNIERAQKNYELLMKARDQAFVELGDLLGLRVGMEEIGKTSWLVKVFDREGIAYPLTEKGNPSFTAGTTGWMQK